MRSAETSAFRPNPVRPESTLSVEVPKDIPTPASLPGFPDAWRAKPKTPVRGGGGLRKRWKHANGCICEWDSQHGEVEMYNKRGKHMGAFDPNTGEAMAGKCADATGTIEP
ncbi:colicin E3/pyocin S6 family cytotoxin [Burkholderia sp. Tr-862]|uniref:colicin E3/pyocin S6 family cytotoxin n=1 Tax=Burkholderia sp. Tr-862 TaxID=2608331 RepID=UPI0032B364EA